MVALAVATLLCAQAACSRPAAHRESGEPSSASQSTGPEEYSATVVRTTTSGDNPRTEQTLIAIDGGLTREEWTERGERRALILRPDLGKSYELWLDRRIYTETSLDPDGIGGSPGANSVAPAQPANESKTSSDKQGKVDVASSEAPGAEEPDAHLDIEESAPPVRHERHDLPDQTIDGHNCKVSEDLSYQPDGRVERVVTFRAMDLKGLAIRTEESGAGPTGVKVTTERRDVKLSVDPSEFVVPGDFKRVSEAPSP